MATMRADCNYTANGQSFRRVDEVSYDNSVQTTPTLEGAKTGVLTTRTDNDTGSITAQASHGIVTGDKVDVHWLDPDGVTYKCRRAMTVGTVASLVVPVDGGSGDALPLAASELRLMVRHEEALVVVGDDLVGIFVSMPQPGMVVFADGSDAELLAVDMTDDTGYAWYSGNGVTNPLAGDSVAKVFLSQYGTAEQSPVVTLIYN